MGPGVKHVKKSYISYLNQDILESEDKKNVLLIYTGMQPPEQTKKSTHDGTKLSGADLKEIQDYFGESDIVYEQYISVGKKQNKEYAIYSTHIDPIGMQHNIPYLAVYASSGKGLHRSDFEIKVNYYKHIDIMKYGIDFLAQNHRSLWLDMQIQDITNTKYRPFSYPKVHIDTFYQSDVVSGYEESCKWHMSISQIEFYDALICRNYFDGKYADITSYKQKAEMEKELSRFFRPDMFTTNGICEETRAFFLMAGEGTWVVSNDGYLLISARDSRVKEKPNAACYSSAGSLEYTSRLSEKADPSKFEADPFLTAARELYEETNLFQANDIDNVANSLELICFGIDIERKLEQFSFIYRSEKTAREILVRSIKAKSKEQLMFAIKLTPKNISLIIRFFDLEPGAIASLILLWQIISN